MFVYVLVFDAVRACLIVMLFVKASCFRCDQSCLVFRFNVARYVQERQTCD